MSHRSFIAAVLITLAATACANTGEPAFGPTIAATPNDPIVSFTDRECRNGTTTGHGMGYEHCMKHMDQVARANGGVPYVAALRSD